MSPDETANAVSAISLIKNGNFGYDWRMSSEFVWAHPRSYVLIPELNRMAPVGFLGLPLVLAMCFAIFGMFGIIFFTPVLALATLWPLWDSLPRTWPKAVKFMTLFVWMGFPAVILYANRGAFAQLPVVCLAVWVWWLITKFQVSSYKFKAWMPAVAGGLLGLALCMRPTEAVWLVPLAVAAWLYGRKTEDDKSRQAAWRQTLWFFVPLFLILIVGAFLGYRTYGSWLVSGYQVRPTMQAVATNVDAALHTQTLSVTKSLPFGLHPRNVLWNVRWYEIWLLWPWTIFLLLASIILVREKFWRNASLWPVAAMAWAVIWVTVFYGNGIYQDSVQINAITIGNSFVRYILPISIAASLAAGFVFSRMWRFWPIKPVAVCLAVALVAAGLWMSVSRDNEGLAADEKELMRYQQFRFAAQRLLKSESFVISDRSDKIFFPSLAAVSPLPTSQQISALRATGARVTLFLPTQDQAGLQAWQEKGSGLIPMFTEGNQTLYDVR